MTKSPIKKVLQKDYVQSAVRFPPALRDRLHEEAKANGRSFNAEIIARLQASPSEQILSEIAELKSMLRKVLDQM
jgi:hypothetical protein